MRTSTFVENFYLVIHKAQVTSLGISVKGESICGAGCLQSRNHFLETLSWKSVPT